MTMPCYFCSVSVQKLVKPVICRFFYFMQNNAYLCEMDKILLEICAGSVASALAAQEGGADRIELCSALPLDGLTPGYGTIKEVKRLLSIPVYVLVRPREGDFLYSKEELAAICGDIYAAKELGADGIVCGALDRYGNIDVEAMEQIMKASKGVSFTFHRAFDVCRNPLESLEILMEMGVNTLLTSGQAATAVEGTGLIKELAATAQAKGLTIMAGCGIKAAHVAALALETGVAAIHLSAKKKIIGAMPRHDYYQTDADEVRNCRKIIDSIN